VFLGGLLDFFLKLSLCSRGIGQLGLPFFEILQPPERRLHAAAVFFLQPQDQIQALLHLRQSLGVQAHLFRPPLGFPGQLP